jgi:hypothetical protein
VATKSSHKKYTQLQLTEIFASQSNHHPNRLQYIIWNNPKKNDSLRLSMSGYSYVIKDLGYVSYRFELDPPLTNKNLLQLERFFPSMYFILQDKFFVFDQEEASMINLIDGNIVAYLNNLESTFKPD